MKTIISVLRRAITGNRLEMAAFGKQLCVLLGSSLLLAECHVADPIPAKSAVSVPVSDGGPSFIIQNNNCTVPCEVSFNWTGRNATSYLWDFGDGQTSVEANAKHTYTLAGTYFVWLKVTGQSGGGMRPVNIARRLTTTPTPIAHAGPDQTITWPLNFAYLNGSVSFLDGGKTSDVVSYEWTKISGPSQFSLGSESLHPSKAIARHLIAGTYWFRLQTTNTLGETGADTVRVNVVDDPQDKNTITFHDLIWEKGDFYGLGGVDIALSYIRRPDFFSGFRTLIGPVAVSLKLELSSSWILLQPTRNIDGSFNHDLYTYDYTSPLLWINNYPTDLSLVGKKSSMKIKLL